MESELESQTKKKTPKPFSIESIIGDRKSPEIDIENNISESSRLSEEEDSERSEGLNRMRCYFNAPFLQQNVNFPFLLGYPEPWLSRVFGSVPPQITQESRRDREEDKRESPVSVGSELESDGAEDNTQGDYYTNYYYLSVNFSTIL